MRVRTLPSMLSEQEVRAAEVMVSCFAAYEYCVRSLRPPGLLFGRVRIKADSELPGGLLVIVFSVVISTTLSGRAGTR